MFDVISSIVLLERAYRVHDIAVSLHLHKKQKRNHLENQHTKGSLKKFNLKYKINDTSFLTLNI